MFQDIKNNAIQAAGNAARASAKKPTTQPTKMRWNAKSIFTFMDKNQDGVISDGEAEDFGFTFMKGKTTTRQEFEEQFEAQQKKLSQNTIALEDFKSCFERSKGGVVKNVPLSQEQQKELLKRIEMYEKYKSTLSDEEKEELERNKHAQLDFAIYTTHGPIPEDYDFSAFPKERKDEIEASNTRRGLKDQKLEHYKEYFGTGGRYEQIKKALKEGKLSEISNEDLSFVLNHTDTTDLVQDGKIGSFTQGSVGDCWFLSQLNNYASTKEGADNLVRRIKDNGDGSYTVTLQNPFEQSKSVEYKISKEELDNFDLSVEGKDYSAGDKDVRILEIATSKLLDEHLPDGKLRTYGIADGAMEKRILVHKALGYQGDISYFSKGKSLTGFITSGREKEKPGELDFKANDDIYQISYKLVRDNNGKAKIIPTIEQTGCKSFVELMRQRGIKPSEVICGTKQKDYKGTEKEQRYIQGGHEYNFVGAKNDDVTVSDPYLTAFPHTIREDEFEEYYGVLTHLPRN